MYKYLMFEKQENIGILTLNRPEVRNALNNEMAEELFEAVKEAERDTSLRALIITGVGDKAFMAGADIKQLKERDFVLARSQTKRRQEIFNTIADLPIPSIAAVNGYALGAGLELILACSIRITSEKGKFASPEVNLGIIPGDGATQRLPRIIGLGRAMDMILSGRMIDAEEAYNFGLVSKVLPQPELLSYCMELANNLAQKPPLAIQYAKEAVNKALDVSLSAGLTFESYLHALACASEDKAEGIEAFINKRKPNYKGR